MNSRHGYRAPSTTTFGDLVAAVFEQALALTSDRREAARLASEVLGRWLSLCGHGRLIAQLAGN